MSKCGNIVERNKRLADIFMLLSVVSFGYFGLTYHSCVPGIKVTTACRRSTESTDDIIRVLGAVDTVIDSIEDFRRHVGPAGFFKILV
jgi:hypothetical protein